MVLLPFEEQCDNAMSQKEGSFIICDSLLKDFLKSLARLFDVELNAMEATDSSSR